jgi:hypothetical protein
MTYNTTAMPPTTTTPASRAVRLSDLTPTEVKALVVIGKHIFISCANLGAMLWGEDGYHGSNCSCPYARPAGRVVKSLLAKGLVQRRTDPDHILYELTRAGERFMKRTARQRSKRPELYPVVYGGTA